MKVFLFKSVVVLAFIYLPATVFSQIESAELTAAGLTCSMCSKAVYKSISELSFVEKVDVNLNTSTYSIKFKPQSTFELDDLKGKVEAAGFSVANLKLVVNFEETEVFNDAHVKLDNINYHFLNVNKQLLKGEHTLTILDKGFVTSKAFKKFSKYTKLECFKSGKVSSCCSANMKSTERIYHVTL